MAQPRGKHCADEQQGDPRGGLQDPEYRHADPREMVEKDGVAMSGLAGAQQVDRELDR